MMCFMYGFWSREANAKLLLCGRPAVCFFAGMIALLSPAKLMDPSRRHPSTGCTLPAMLRRSEVLIRSLRKLKPADIAELMEVSPRIADETAQWFHDWHTPIDPEASTPAVLLFRGEVYRGLDADSFTPDDLQFAQKHLRILSGLYGVLRPLDLTLPYRLMMGTPFSPDERSRNLYQWWGNDLAQHLAEETRPGDTVVNLASEEYFRAVPEKVLGRRVLTCDFRERKGDRYVSVSTYAKQARGRMARFIITQRITQPEGLLAFREDRYAFQPALSSESKWVFTR
jgi:cytoplasmic iron level regulating protein YaaA (DUF328/UPF0246 family)